MPRSKKKITPQNKKPEPGRKANGMGSLRQKDVKGNTYWEGRYSVTDPLTGKTKRYSVSDKNQAEAARKLREALSAIDEGTYVEPSKMTVGEWLDTWLNDYVEPSVKPYTLDSYRSSCKNHIKPALGAMKLTALSRQQIQHFYNSVLSIVYIDFKPLCIRFCIVLQGSKPLHFNGLELFCLYRNFPYQYISKPNWTDKRSTESSKTVMQRSLPSQPLPLQSRRARSNPASFQWTCGP